MNHRIHLLSCSACHRQLDVTLLEIGDEVQCVCDRVLIVGPPREVTVRGLSCGHCGGVIGPADETCSYCRAALSVEDRKETTLCPCCATRLPNDSRHCKSCGVELRAAAVPALPRDGACPSCAGRLRVHLLEAAEVIECANGCGGLWCGREMFQRLQRDAQRAAPCGVADAESLQRARAQVVPDGARSQYLPCLTCGELMQRRHFRHANRPSGIVLDVCRDHGVWFDPDELAGALAFVRAQELARSGLGGGELPLGTGRPDRPAPGGVDAFAPRRRPLVAEIVDALGAIFSFSLFD